MKMLLKAIIRVLAILLIIQLLSVVVQYLGLAISAFNSSTSSNRSNAFVDVGVSLFVCVLGVLVALFFWIKADWVVKRITGNSDDNGLVINISNQDLIKVILRGLGIYLIVISIPKLAGTAAYYLYMTKQYSGTIFPPDLIANQIQQWVVQGITLLIGKWLLSGSKPILNRLLNLWKYGGTKPDTEKDG